MSESEFEESCFVVTQKREKFTNCLLEEAWRDIRGQRQRDNDLPAIVRYDPSSGHVCTREWYVAGRLHRMEGAARQQVDPQTGIVTFEAWWQDGKLHRANDMPAWIERSSTTGLITREEWYCKGKCHRDSDLPARIVRSPETGRVLEEGYVVDDRDHRASGPAHIEYDPETGEVTRTQYYLNGRFIPKSRWNNVPSPT